MSSTHPSRDREPAARAGEPAVRRAAAEDLEEVVRLHRDAFPDFLMVRIGPPLLRAYHRLVLRYPGGFTFLASVNGTPAGFVAAFMDPPAFYAELKRRRLRFALASLPGLLRRPALIRRLRASARRAEVEASSRDGSRRCELASIGVLPVARGHGVGKMLMYHVRDEATRRGAQEIVLTTDAEGNDEINAWYRSLGLVQTGISETGAGRVLNEYTWDLRGTERSGSDAS